MEILIRIHKNEENYLQYISLTTVTLMSVNSFRNSASTAYMIQH
jgi:hypothetical protein